ncbi:hypothetical protein ACFWWC_47340 [Streptomyces sp. NPDC058642]|uniref:hypothetical protein n=1 Tax=Streptomyces sp. NPDC058642 TaxID=3346572 RepID=UPI003651E8C4
MTTGDELSKMGYTAEYFYVTPPSKKGEIFTMMRRSLGTAAALSAIMATCVIAAPAASATPDGCGDLTNGQLCLKDHTVGKTGSFKFRVSYDRHVSGEITVKLGTQRKNDQITAGALWFGNKKTTNGYAELSKTHPIDRGDCIRAVMEYQGSTFVGKWRCP